MHETNYGSAHTICLFIQLMVFIGKFSIIFKFLFILIPENQSLYNITAMPLTPE